MTKCFITSDHHWGHANILTFKRKDGIMLRNFSSVEEMDEYMIECWNKVVRPVDKVYHLGDVCFHNRVLDAIMPRLNGTKVLIKGNHDSLKVSQYMKYFKDIRAYDRLDTFILSHVPVHPDSLNHKTTANLHGHTHYLKVTSEQYINDGFERIEDERYFNVSVECNNYTPWDFEQIREYYKNVTF